MTVAEEMKLDPCSKCRWWLSQRDGVYGECRIHAPRDIDKDITGRRAIWPITLPDDTCGDMTPKDARWTT